MPTLPTISAADSYHSARANAAWEALPNDAAKTAALLRAQDYILAVYSLVDGLEDDNATLATATIMLAGEMTAQGSLLDKNAGVRKSKKEMEGVGSIEVEYNDSKSDPYPLITATLKPILKFVPAASVRSIRLVL